MIAKKITDYLVFLFISFAITGCWDDSNDKTSDTASASGSGAKNGTKPIDSVSVAECAGTAQRLIQKRTATGTSSLAVKEINLSEFQEIKNKPGLYAVGAAFIVPDDAISFQLIATEASASLTPTESIFFYSLETPAKVEMITKYERSVFGTTWEPALPETRLEKGDWSFIMINGRASGKVYLGIRSGIAASRPILVVQPFLASKRYTPSNLKAALTHMMDIYDNAGIQVNMSDIISLPEKYAETEFEFTNLNTASLVCQGVPDQINLFFVEDLVATDFGGGSVLGIAGGIPGPQGLQNRHNGVLIGLSAHDQSSASPVLADNLLGETIAHETGHFLGLYHTTESSDNEYDSLKDTPECTVKDPTPEKCLDKDGRNLMFWRAPTDPSIEQVILTADQQTVLKRAPIMR